MAHGLPNMAFRDGIQKYKQTKFAGYNHNLGAGDGELWDMENLTSDYYPLLSPRAPRHLVRTLSKPNGFYAKDGLYWVDGTGFYADGVLKGMVSDGKKQIVGMGAYIIILPDKKFYNHVTDEFGALEASWSGSATIQNGTYVGEEAAANTIYAAGAGSLFHAGDAVTISGAVTHTENNKTIIIREIEGNYLRFYENSFVIDEGGDTENLVLTRTMPELDFACENENRLWGCKGDSIYASKLGDPFNWNVFDGVATDSFAVDVGSAGDFTGCTAYLGYPCFFKEENIYKVYGDRPSNFQVMGSASLGVEEGSERSIAIAGEVLFYLSRVGIVAYSGGIPQSVADAFGPVRYRNAVAGSDGLKYYVSMEDTWGRYHLFVYDSRRYLWHREDGLEAVAFGWDKGLYILDAQGRLWLNGNAREVPEGAETESVEWSVEWADFYGAETSNSTPMPVKKHIGKIQIRMELDNGATATIKAQFDGGEWETVATAAAEKKRSYYLPIIPRRCDHFRLRMEGTGDCKLYSLVREIAAGSEND